MALIDTVPSNKTAWQRVNEAVLAATGGDLKTTAEIMPDIYRMVLAERALAKRGV